jgi:hypothetical protein
MNMSLGIFRKWLAAYMLIACVFILAACNSSSNDSGGAVPPAFPSEALSNIGINITAPDGGTIESVNTESGSIGVVWNSVAEPSAETFITDMEIALETGGLISQDDADAKIVTWEYTKEATKYTVTITYVKQDHELNGSAVKAGRMLLTVEPKSEGSDLVLDDSVRPLAAYIAFNSNSYSDYKIGIIEGNSELTKYTVVGNAVNIPPVGSDAAKDAKVFAFGNRPKDGSATVVLERYNYSAAGHEGSSLFTTFDPNGTVDDSTIAANQKDWGLKSTQPTNYATNVRNTVRVGNYLYIMSYDVRRISKVHITTGTLVSSVEYPAIDGYKVTGQDIIVTKGRIFALFAVPDSAFANYLDSIVIEVKHTDNDRAPTFGDEVKVGKNAQSLVSVDNYIYVPAIGGMQNNDTSNGANSRIDRITLSENGMIVDDKPVYYVDDDYDFHGLVIGKGKALILRVMNDSSLYTTVAYLTQINTADLHTVSNVAVSTIPAANHLIDEEMQGGYTYAMVYDDVLDHFWFATAGKLTVYNKDLSANKVFSMKDDLYGVAAGAVSSIALFNSELGTVRTSTSSYIPHAVRSGLFSTPEEYYKSLK